MDRAHRHRVIRAILVSLPINVPNFEHSSPYYWLPNDAALPMINPEIRDNTTIFPTEAMLLNAEVLLPLSKEGEEVHQAMWDTLIKADE